MLYYTKILTFYLNIYITSVFVGKTLAHVKEIFASLCLPAPPRKKIIVPGSR